MSGGRLPAATVVVFAAAALVACAELRGPAGGAVVFPPARSSFELSGRLSARHGADGLSASFHWNHDGSRDEMELSSPLGQTVARLVGDANRVELVAADGRSTSASDWQTLTTRSLGWPLPVAGLAYWVQGVPRDGAAFAVEATADSAPAVLRQDGWTIVYGAFVPDGEGIRRPSRLTLDYGDVEIRLALDAWP